jgi:hypothetical protein
MSFAFKGIIFMLNPLFNTDIAPLRNWRKPSGRKT